jgi:hypothetical protein
MFSQSKTATDVPQALFGAWDWRNYQTTLGAMLTICIFTFWAGTFAFEDPVQRTPAPIPSPTSLFNHHNNNSSSSSMFEMFLRNWFGLVRALLVSLTCATQGELTLFLSIMLMSGVDLERILGSIKLREALIILGLQRIFIQQAVSSLLASTIFYSSLTNSSSQTNCWSFTPSAAWMAVTVAMMRRILVPPRRCFRLFGLPLDEQTISDLFVFQILLVSEDSWCFFTSATVALLNCSKWSPIHLRSRFFPKLWHDDVGSTEATVLARFLPSHQIINKSGFE